MYEQGRPNRGMKTMILKAMDKHLGQSLVVVYRTWNDGVAIKPGIN